MTTPFYVSPQQVLADKAEYARKGIARGRSIVICEVLEGILFIAENPMRTLHKVSEIYDRIAFAAVGRYNEFEALRVYGIRKADVTGYSYSRHDVTARSLAGTYAQQLGATFTHELKPWEVEILIAEVKDKNDPDSVNRLYRVTFDGQISDETGIITMGGAAEDLHVKATAHYEKDLSMSEAFCRIVQAMANHVSRPIKMADFEVAMLDFSLERRCFRRFDEAALTEIFGASQAEPERTGEEE